MFVRARVPAIAAALWAVNWLALRATGQAYSTRVLYAGWQFLPVDAAGRDPFRAVWHLHTQPPGWNLLVAGITAWSPVDARTSHQLVSVAAGVVLAAAIAATLEHLGASRPAALGVTVIATMHSQVMANAFEPRYDLAVTALLAVLVWAAVTRRSPVLACLVATVLVMSRSLFHPVWLVVTLALLVWATWPAAPERASRPRLAVALLVPLVVVGGWTVKNAVQFGTTGLSSFAGMNLLRSIEPAIPHDRLVELRAEGVVSGVAAAGTFRLYDDYAAWMQLCLPEPDDPAVLADATKPIPEPLRTQFDPADTANFNYRCYLDVYRRAGVDARALIRAEPGEWVKARAWATNNWFQLPAAPRSGWLSGAEADVSRVVLVGVPHPGLPAKWDANFLVVHDNPISLTLIAATGALAVACWRAVRRRSFEGRTPARTFVVLVSWVVVWNAFAGIVVELGEQERFRSATDPLVLAAAGWWLLQRAGRLRPVAGPVADTPNTPDDAHHQDGIPPTA